MAKGGGGTLAARLRRNRRASTLLIAGATVLVLATIAIVGRVLDKRLLYPGPGDRVDVRELLAAPLAAVCPEAARTPERAALERCVATLGALAEGHAEPFVRLAVPQLEDVLEHGAPSFKNLVEAAGHAPLTQAVAGKQPLVVGFPLPGALFRTDRLGAEPKSLVVYGAQDARVCLGERCGGVIQMYAFGDLLFPLLLDRPARSTEWVWFVLQDKTFPLGFLLGDGIFVTDPAKMTTAERFMPFLRYGTGIVYGALYAGLFLLAFGFACLWPEFPDYAAFVNLAATLTSLAVSEQLLGPLLGPQHIHTLHVLLVGARIHFVAASLLLLLAIARVRTTVLVGGFFAGIVAAVGVPLVLVPGELGAGLLQFEWKFNNVVSWTSTAAAVVIPAVSATLCYRRLRHARLRQLPLSEQLDHRRRFLEQLLTGALFLGVVWQTFANHADGQRQGNTQGVPITALLLFAILGTLLYHSTAKIARTHFRAQGASEATNLLSRLSRRAYAAWLAQPRDGVMLQIDIANSSLATLVLNSRMHRLMASLRDLVRTDLRQADYHWVVAKKNGDEWILMLSRKHATLGGDLAEVAELVQRLAPRWHAQVEGFVAGCSIHVNVLALRDYTLSETSSPNAALAALETDAPDAGEEDLVDFVSSDANYLMKWLKKAPSARTITVGAHCTLLPEALVATATASGSVATIARTTTPELTELVYACLPWKEGADDAAASPDRLSA